MNRKTLAQISVIVFLIVIGLMFSQLPCAAQEQGNNPGDENKPERLITMAAEYPGVEIPFEENVTMNLIFHNKGKSDENVDVWVAEKPEGWETEIKTYKFTVTGIHVPSGESKNLTFEATPGKDVKPGKYEFRIKAQTRDGQFKMAETIVATMKEKEEEKPKESKGVKLSTTYPVLRGPSDANFEFSIEVNSDLDEDTVFDLAAQGPDGWEINFKPAYESKYISSLQIKANQSKNVSVEVKPSAGAQAGQYPVKMQARAGDAKGEIDLMVILTGTYGLEAGTPTGLLSLDAKQGKSANVSIYVKNTGSAPNNDIKFMTFKPENWKVEFKPEKIETLQPGELKQVEVMITPYEEALVGDYSVAVEVQGEKASKTLEFRTSVKASAAWGWIGIGIIVVVIAGLTTLFRWLGRR
jgi:uncharacterized membrane protein